MAEKQPRVRNEYWRDYSKQRYDKQANYHRLFTAISYYRRKKKEGLNWEPRESSTLYRWCKDHDLDPIAIIEGTQKVSDAK